MTSSDIFPTRVLLSTNSATLQQLRFRRENDVKKIFKRSVYFLARGLMSSKDRTLPKSI